MRIEAPLGTFDTAKISAPVILTMRDDDFPGPVLAGSRVARPAATRVDGDAREHPRGPLFQPVQRMMHVAMVQIACNSLGYPRLDPKRVASAGIVIRRLSGDHKQAWMRSPNGLFRWINLTSETPSAKIPIRRCALLIHRARQSWTSCSAALRLTTALTESSTPAFVAPPTPARSCAGPCCTVSCRPQAAR